MSIFDAARRWSFLSLHIEPCGLCETQPANNYHLERNELVLVNDVTCYFLHLMIVDKYCEA